MTRPRAAKALSAAAPALLLAALWLALRPWREFPLDDDWVYFLEVRRWLATGAVRILDISSPALVSHVYWGGLFAKVFGLSFASLRVSTLILALAALLVLGAEAPFAALLLAASPLFFVSSLTFMSDVPFAAWSVFAWACHARGREKDDARWLAASSLFSSAALLIRQIGVLAPAAQLWLAWREKRLTWRLAFWTAALPAACSLGHHWWFVHVHGPTWASEMYVTSAALMRLTHPLLLVWQLYWRAGAAAVYLALAAFPLALVAARRPTRSGWIALAAIAPLLWRHRGLPYFNGVIGQFGLGVVTISGRELKTSGPLGTHAWAFAITAAAVFSFVVFASRARELAAAWREDRRVRLLLLPGLLEVLAMAGGPKFFDRYLLPALPGVLLLCWKLAAPKTSRDRLLASTAAAAMLAWSVVGSWDYLAWNDAKWRLAEEAVAAGTPADRILGGVEWCGLKSYEASMDALKREKPLSDIGEWDWLRLETMTAIETFSPYPMDGFKVAAYLEYRTPLSARPAKVYLHARQD